MTTESLCIKSKNIIEVLNFHSISNLDKDRLKNNQPNEFKDNK